MHLGSKDNGVDIEQHLKDLNITVHDLVLADTTIGAVAMASVALTFAGYCMALTSLSAFIPANFETLVVSLATCTVVLLVTSAASQVLSMGFGPSLGLQVIFWNIVLVSRVGNRFLTDLWLK
jgi:hypothetical protein